MICQENFEKILMGFPVKRAHFTILSDRDLRNLKERVYPGLCKVTGTSRYQHAPYQHFLLVL